MSEEYEINISTKMMNSHVAWAEHHLDEKWSHEADQVEWQAFINGSCPFDGAQMDDEVSGQLIDYQSESESEAENDTAPSETTDQTIDRKLKTKNKDILKEERRREEIATGVRLEIERRSNLLSEKYPFEVEEACISLRSNRGRAGEIYLFCLKLAICPTPSDREHFENMVAESLRNYLGDRSISHIFGWQSLPEEQRPTRIKEKIRAISNLTNEWIWKPDENFPDDPPPKLVKDLGLDVIAWIPSPDNRVGQVFLVAQCATGKTDWDDKLHDASWPRIENWIRPTPQYWSIRCFAIPFHIPNSSRFQEVSRLGGLFLDRSRLTLLF